MTGARFRVKRRHLATMKSAEPCSATLAMSLVYKHKTADMGPLDGDI
jgi:hypothetical protein